MKLALKQVNNSVSCSNFFLDEHTKLGIGEFIEWDGRAKYNAKLLEEVTDEVIADRDLKEIKRGNASPMVDPMTQGHAAAQQKLQEQNVEKTAEVAALKQQLAAQAAQIAAYEGKGGKAPSAK